MLIQDLVKVISVDNERITFDDGSTLYSEHEQDCCERHYLDFSHLTLTDFEGMVFDLAGDSFFERVVGLGIRLMPKNDHPVAISAYSDNNGYYSYELVLCLKNKEGSVRTYDVTECQGVVLC